MKQQWTAQELLDHWTPTPQEIKLIRSISQTGYNQIGSGTLYKWFQHEGDFPKRKQDIPSVIVGHIAEQLQIPRNAFDAYALHGRTARRHQHRIRQLLQFRAG